MNCETVPRERTSPYSHNNNNKNTPHTFILQQFLNPPSPRLVPPRPPIISSLLHSFHHICVQFTLQSLLIIVVFYYIPSNPLRPTHPIIPPQYILMPFQLIPPLFPCPSSLDGDTGGIPHKAHLVQNGDFIVPQFASLASLSLTVHPRTQCWIVLKGTGD